MQIGLEVARKIEEATPHLYVAGETLVALERLFSLVNQRPPRKPPTSPYRQVVGALMARAYSPLAAIRHLCTQGYSSEAQPILRALLELTLSGVYMNRGDHDALATRFVEFEAVIKCKLLRDMIEMDPDTDPGLRERKKAHLQQLELKRKQFENSYVRGKSNYWSGMDTRTLSRKLGPEWFGWYVLVYRPSSAHVHVNAFSLRQDIRHPSPLAVDRRSTITFGPTAERIRVTLELALIFVYKLLDAWAEEMELKDEADREVGPLMRQLGHITQLEGPE